MGKLLKNAVLVAGISLIVIFLLMIIGDEIKANAIKEIQESQAYSNQLAQNCTCLAHEKLFCNSGFELKGNRCVNESENLFTNAYAGCSEYNCSGEIKIWNNETNKWS